MPSLPPYLVGRDELLDDLITRLLNGTGGLALSAEGLPGVGKTTLATALAYHPTLLNHFSDGVLWAGLGTQPDVSSLLGQWATALGSDVAHLPTEAARAEAVKAAIGQRKLLLVIDDAWQIEPARRLRCGGPYCAHVLTTRDKELARAFAGRDGMAAIPTLEDDPAYTLLAKLAPEACAADPAAARSLAMAVGGLPLALELLGGYLAAPEYIHFPDLSTAALAELGDPARRLQLAQQRLGSHESAATTLQATIALSLAGLPDEARDAFYALGAFAPKPASFDRPAAEAVSRAGAATLALLAARNLLEIEEDRLALHQTLADAARAAAPPQAISILQSLISNLQSLIPNLQSLIPNLQSPMARHRAHYLALANADRDDWRRIEAAYAQVKWAWANAPTDNEVQMDFIWALRTYQERRGLWQDQLNWFNVGLLFVQRLSNRKDEGTLLNEIGRVYDRIGKRDKALEAYKLALSIYEELSNRAYQARTLTNIGLVYSHLGQWQKALSYYQRTVPIFEEVDDRVGLAGTLNNIGGVYNALGQQQEALGYHQRALSVREEVGDRAGVAQTLNNIGAVYNALGQRHEALSYFQRALPIREEVGDRDGESTTRWWLGLLMQAEGNLAEAVAQLQRAVELAAQVQSPSLERLKAALAQAEAEGKL